jgi:hypothetical protein
MADYPGALTFWKQVAARYMNNPLVAFDLYNEPHDISDAIWRNGGSITWKGQTYKVAGMQQMYDAVRSTGAQNLVFVTGQAWGNLPPRSVGPVDGFNLVYAVHAYTCVEATPPTCTNKNPYDPKQFFQWWTEQEKTFPIVVTEFGWPNPEDGLYIRNVIAYAVSHGWGWAVYTWGVGGWGPFAMHMPPGPPGTTYQPRPAGQPVLAAFPGA